MGDRTVLERLHSFLEQRDLDAFIITQYANRRYVSGFSGSNGVVVVAARGPVVLYTDFRYVEQARAEAPECEIAMATGDFFSYIMADLYTRGFSRIGFEKNHVVVELYERFCESLPQVEWIPESLAGIRVCKTEREIATIRAAAALCSQALTAIQPMLRPGVTEIAVAAELECTMRRLGAEKPAFDTIVASGWRGALPHGRASDKIIVAGELVTIDFGAILDGYHSDMTRTICIGKADEQQRLVYQTVLTAQKMALAEVRAGVSTRHLDTIARDYIRAAGYGERFGHGLGHGVGLAIHEEPRLSPADSGDVIVMNGMVFSVEPGIYIPGWGGVRIEDLVAVKEQGIENLSSFPKELIEND